ncbi:MAG TPA: hypothetical protein VHN78_10480, partial [Chloroflexota bacterium]|nr:hypothetical protein [Chloroflexota bacterium]
MRCDEVRDPLLLPAAEADGVEDHLAACADCGGFARRMGRLDAALRSTLLVEPPAELQARLATLARAAAQPAASPTPVAPAPRRSPFAIPALSFRWAPRTPAA